MLIELSPILLPDAPVARDAVHTIEITGRMEDVSPVKEKHLGSHQADIGMLTKGLRYLGQPVRIGLGVVVEEDDNLAPGAPDASVHRASKAPIRGEPDQDHLGIVPLDESDGLIGGGIVGDDDLKVGIGLAAQGVETSGQVECPVPVGDDHRSKGQISRWQISKVIHRQSTLAALLPRAVG